MIIAGEVHRIIHTNNAFDALNKITQSYAFRSIRITYANTYPAACADILVYFNGGFSESYRALGARKSAAIAVSSCKMSAVLF